MSVLVLCGGRACCPGCAPAPTAPGWSSFRVARVVRAGQAGAGRAQRRCQQVRKASGPWPVGADRQGPLPGVAGRAGPAGARPGSGAYRGWLPAARVVVVAEEAGPGGQVGGDVRGDHPARVDLPGFQRMGGRAGPWPWRCGHRRSRRRRARGGPRRRTGGGGCRERRRSRDTSCDTTAMGSASSTSAGKACLETSKLRKCPLVDMLLGCPLGEYFSRLVHRLGRARRERCEWGG